MTLNALRDWPDLNRIDFTLKLSLGVAIALCFIKVKSRSETRIYFLKVEL